MERRLVCQGNFNTTRCVGVGFDSGRAKRTAKINPGDLQWRSRQVFRGNSDRPHRSNRTQLCLRHCVSIPRIVWITIDGIFGKGGMAGAIRGVFTGRRRMGICGFGNEVDIYIAYRTTARTLLPLVPGLTMTELPPEFAVKSLFRPDHDQGSLRRGRLSDLVSFISPGSENPGGFWVYTCL
jgi:hypothetical protein